jgi:hypothetical protein
VTEPNEFKEAARIENDATTTARSPPSGRGFSRVRMHPRPRQITLASGQTVRIRLLGYNA